MEYIEKSIQGAVVVPAGLDAVWDAWTTPEGIRSFFAPECNIQTVPGGPFEIFFDPGAEPGFRGSEGMKIMAVQPKKMISFTWNSPPSLSRIRNQQTQVIVRFHSVSDHETKVILTHHGWGVGEDWDRAYGYFESAWKKIVLPRLKQRFESGPIRWD